MAAVTELECRVILSELLMGLLGVVDEDIEILEALGEVVDGLDEDIELEEAATLVESVDVIDRVDKVLELIELWIREQPDADWVSRFPINSMAHGLSECSVSP